MIDWNTIVSSYPEEIGIIFPFRNKERIYQLLSSDPTSPYYTWLPNSIEAFRQRLQDLGIEHEWMHNTYVVKFKDDENDAAFRFYFAELIKN